MNSPLLLAKLHVPPTLPQLVKRPRLFALLDNFPHPRRVTLISAPPGYGKTTLAADWIAHRRQLDGESAATDSSDDTRPCFAWYTLDDDDNNAGCFLTYLTLALQRMAPETSREGLLALENQRPPATMVLLAALLNEIGERERQATLILDDFQRIRSRAVQEAIAFLIEHQPDCLHVIITSRVDPPLPLALLRSQGRLLEVRQDTLQFNLAETAEFLCETCGLAASDKMATALAEQTEGWVAGLQMTAVSLLQGNAVNPSYDDITHNNCHISDYFMEEVISRQPPAVRRFLLHTAVLDQLTASLCDSVVDLPAAGDRLPGTPQPVDSQMMLEYLQRNNHFVIAQDGQRSWFRYHRLFAEFLRRELAQKEPNLAPVLHRRASGWYAAHAMPEAAIDHALAAGEFATAIRLIEQVARAVTVRSELLMLQRWLDRLPADMMHSQPRLLTYRAAAHLLSGEPLETVQADLDAAMENGHDEQTQVIVLTLRGLIALYQGRVAASRQLLQQSVSSMSNGRNIWRTLAMDELALNHLRYGNRRQAESVMIECLAAADRTDNVMNGVLALCRLGELALLECRCEDADWLYAEALVRSTCNGNQLPIAGIACIGLGRLHLERGELDEAVERLEEGVHRIHGWGDTMAIEGYLQLVAAQSLRQKWAEAEAALQRARKISHSFDAMTIDDDLVELQQVKLWLAHGDDLAATMWLNRQLSTEYSAPAAKEPPSLPAIQKAMTMAKVCLATGKPGAALSLLAIRSTVTVASLPQRIQIDLDLLEALVLYALGRMHTARMRFAGALEQAAAQNVILPFLEHAGPALSTLLISAVQESGYRSFVIQLLERHDTRQSKRYCLSPTGQNVLVGPLLTTRELEILTLIACGLRNSEIGAQLFIAPSTVKTHINNLYRKLDVHSRTRALERARQLELL